MTNISSVWKKWNNRILGLAILTLSACSSTNVINVQKARHDHVNETLSYEKGPLKREDISRLQYYEVNDDFRVIADIQVFAKPDTVVIPTYSGKEKKFLRWGEAEFELSGRECKLLLYQNVRYLARDPDHLFIPFKDQTSGETTYGGGRYLDLKMKNVRRNRMVIDFNLAYNPWCAYSDGFNCPIPPTANHLEVLVEAGEKNYAKH